MLWAIVVMSLNPWCKAYSASAVDMDMQCDKPRYYYSVTFRGAEVFTCMETQKEACSLMVTILNSNTTALGYK